MPRRRIPREVREFVAERAGFCCEYCLSQEDCCPDSLSVEHIHPVVRLRIIGLQPIGRATVERLELNRRGVLNLRFALIQIDKHPPQ